MPALNQRQYILNFVPCGICQVALDGMLTILYANPSYYELYGYTAQNAEVLGFTNARQIIPEPDYPAVYEKIQCCIREGLRNFQLEYRGVHRSGNLLWLLVRCFYDPTNPGSILCALFDIADRKKMEEALHVSIEESKIAYQLTDKLMFTFDVADRRLHQPESEAEEFGLAAVTENVPYSVAASGVIADESLSDYIGFYESIMRGKPSGHAVVKKKRKNGDFGWYDARFSTIFDEVGRPKRAIISCENITKRREREMTYHKWRQYFKAQEGKTLGYYEYNLTQNTHERSTGDTPPAYLQNLHKYTETVRYTAEHFVREADRDRFYRFFNRDRLLARFYDGQNQGSLEYLRIGRNGRLFWVRAVIQLIQDPYNSDVLLFMMTLDIDADKKEELRLRRQIEYDRMTGILNRETFIARMGTILERGYHSRHALIMLDIDHFKMHNDSYGHPYGDQIIRETARLLDDFLRKDDLCARMGGDEFMVFLNNIKSERKVLPRISSLCRRLHRECPDKYPVSCSLGVVFFPRDGENFQELYRCADIALYTAKNSGRATFCVYRREMSGPAHSGY